MNWQALWNDGLVISVHALVAIFAMAVGAIQLTAPKGTLRHQWFGYVWVGTMAIVAMTSFWIHEFRWWGPFSIIHVLSLLVLATLVYSINAVRRGNVIAHRNSMVQLYVLALLLTGAFTLVPGRTMHAVLFGG
ncbi:MAG: DUF2306 domain-containing protein [Bacteroidota bacterium]